MRIEEILKEKKISKAELGRRMNKSKQTMTTAFRNPTLSNIEEMAQVLGMPTYELFISKEEKDAIVKSETEKVERYHDLIRKTEDALGIEEGTLEKSIANISDRICKIENILGVKPCTLFSTDKIDKMLEKIG